MALKQHGTANSTCIKNKFIRLHYHSQKKHLSNTQEKTFK